MIKKVIKVRVPVKKTIRLGSKKVEGKKQKKFGNNQIAKGKKLTAEMLDKDLDKYFVKNGNQSKVKSNLDMDLDEYMKKSKK